MKTHLSEEQISDWLAGRRSREAADHLRDCPGCAAQIADTEKSLLLFRNSAYRSVECSRNQPQKQASRTSVRWAAAAVAITAALLIAVTLHRAPEVQPRQEVFLKIPYVIPPAPYERTEVIRMEVPVAALIEAGFTMNAPASDSVRADVLVGQDRRPLAVAFPENKQQDKQ
jgi:hypothetical protein